MSRRQLEVSYYLFDLSSNLIINCSTDRVTLHDYYGNLKVGNKPKIKYFYRHPNQNVHGI